MQCLEKKQKSQNCVKAAIAFVCTTCKRQLLFALLQLITFVCTSANDNILCTTAIANFCRHHCNFQCSLEYRITTVIDCQMQHGNCQLVMYFCYCLGLHCHTQLQLTTIVSTITTEDYCILQNNINVIYIDSNNTHKFIAAL